MNFSILRSLAAALALLPVAVLAQDFPARNISIVVPYPPGGVVDPVARLLAPALAKELGGDGILVNCVAPGFTMSDGVKANPVQIEKLQEVSVAARVIRRDQLPEDVVGAVVFLCSPGAAFITGQSLVVDGGAFFN